MTGSSDIILDGPRLSPFSGKNASGVVIFFHGFGSNGDDLISIGEELGSIFPDIAFISPHAPDICPGIPFGRQWFGLEYPLSEESCRLGAESVRDILDSFIRREARFYDIALDRVVLFGFSQGAMVSLYTGLRFSEGLGGILGYSGFLPGLDRLEEEKGSVPPILLVHGSADEVVPVSAFERTSSTLTALNMTYRKVLCPGLGHGIDRTGLSACVDFLRDCVGF